VELDNIECHSEFCNCCIASKSACYVSSGFVLVLHGYFFTVYDSIRYEIISTLGGRHLVSSFRRRHTRWSGFSELGNLDNVEIAFGVSFLSIVEPSTYVTACLKL
jgi:hypothetical protein